MDEILQTIRDNDVTTLDISFKRISNVDLTRIAEALTTNTLITMIDLSGNKIRNPSSLAKALTINTTLTTLYLSDNEIEDLSSLAEALESNTTLKELNLNNNEIEDPSSLAEALTTNTTLTTLYLSYNKIEDLSSLAGALTTNTALITLWFDGNPYKCDRDVLETIRGSLSLNRDNSRNRRSTLFGTMFNALAGSALRDDFSQ